MHTVEENPERVLIVGVQTDAVTDFRFQSLMKEMKSLTQTAQGIPVTSVTQKLSEPHHKSIVGSGKLTEIKGLVESENIDLVIFLNALSPSGNQYLERELNVRVIDRIQLILDIFAQRAQSQAGKLQVELAQLEYLLPRIIGKGTALSRLGGGIGTRGPGETQLETDRRVIRRQISRIKKDLKVLEAHRERTRVNRRSGREFNIGLVGYTNAGKSTILRELTASETYVQDQLFATLDPMTRKFSIHGQDIFTITDTVGFIDELPTQLIYAFRSTLEEIRDVDILLHVVDASHPARQIHEETVINLMKDLKMDSIPMLTVYNKMDNVRETFTPTMNPSVQISALSEQGIDDVKEAIWDNILQIAEEYTVEVRPEEADLLALYRNKTLVEKLEFDEERELYILRGYRRRLTY